MKADSDIYTPPLPIAHTFDRLLSLISLSQFELVCFTRWKKPFKKKYSLGRRADTNTKTSPGTHEKFNCSAAATEC